MSHARGEYLEALHHTQRCLDLNRAADYPLGIANALNNVGWRHAQLGNYDDALRFCLAGLRLTQRIGDRSVEAITWDSIGYVQHRQSRYAEAIASYERALELIEDTGESQLEGAFRMRLGDAHMAAGAVDAARATWRQALTIFDDLAHPEADAVRALLDEAR
ncbi:MAG: hypothetical protein AUI10_07485 [Actinobacteria bacterium 13_2_20CM_2_72_6]|nr:MAG: hypothetical protein AUI10_07485 [Actinobacteria bacterium 13_2_20CM_2_72_6]